VREEIIMRRIVLKLNKFTHIIGSQYAGFKDQDYVTFEIVPGKIEIRRSTPEEIKREEHDYLQ
jgi:hypothetical protein